MEAADHIRVADNYLREGQSKLPSDPRAAVPWIHRMTSLAADHIDKARALDPSATAIIDGIPMTLDHLIADCLRMQGTVETRHGWYKADVTRGMDAIRKALKYRPHSAELHLSMAIAHLRLEQDSQAKPHLDKTIELDPTHQLAHKIRDGSATFLPAENSERQQFWTNIFTDFWLWVNIFFIGMGIYLLYRIVQAFRYANGEFLEYSFWFLLLLGSVAAFEWVKDKIK